MRTPVKAQSNYPNTVTNQRLDGVIHALQNLPSWNIYGFDSTGTPVPWMEVMGVDVAEQLVIRESDIAFQVQTVSVQIMEWGVLAARAQRVWEVEQRLERTWKAQLLTGAMKAGEKLTEKQQEALYRADSAYDSWKVRVERAAEAVNCTQAVLEGFRAKKEMLRAAIRPAQEQGALAPSFGPT